MDTRRCVVCGHPACDHLDRPLRYVLRPWLQHYLLGKARVLSRGWKERTED
jgi:hypothetical protein